MQHGVPARNDSALERLLGYEPSESSPTSKRTSKHLARLGVLSRSTQERGWEFFTQHIQFALALLISVERVPVAAIPIQVIRTYDSRDKREATSVWG